MRLAVFFERFGPYHYARLNALGEHCALCAIEFWPDDDTYDWDQIFGEERFSRRVLFASGSKKIAGRKEVESRINEVLIESDRTLSKDANSSGEAVFPTSAHIITARKD